MADAARDNRADRGADRSDAVLLLLLAVGVIGVTGVDVFSVVDERARAGRPVPLWEPAVWELSSGAVLVALLPGVLALARRFPIWPLTPRKALVHAVGLIAFSLVHVLAMGLVRAGIYRLAGGDYDPLGPLGNWPYELRKDALTYLACLALHRAWRSAARPGVHRVGEPVAPLEIRDGARRHVLAPERIDWVEAAGNYVELHGPAGPILHRASLAQMQERLAPAGFVRIHRSRLVRLAAVRRVETNPAGDFVVVLADGTRLGGSRRHRIESLSPALDPAARSD